MSSSMFTLPPSTIRDRVIRCMKAQLVPFITGSPGVGKSAIFKQIAKDYNLMPIDVRLSQCAPEDLMGLPMRNPETGKAYFAPFEIFPIKGDKLPKGYDGWMLILDEFNSAPKLVQAAAYKIALDRMIGQEHLHENCFVVAAGNLMADRAIVNQLSTAMQSRLIHFEVELSNKDFMDHALKTGFDHRVLGFLEFQPGRLHDFKPDHTNKTFACPRTWEFVSDLIKGEPVSNIPVDLVAGAISDGPAVEFTTFIKEYEKLPKYRDILADPNGLQVPGEPSTRYALMTSLIDQVKPDELGTVSKYVKRFSPEFQVIFFRGIAKRNPRITAHPDFAANMNHLTKFIAGDLDDTANAA